MCCSHCKKELDTRQVVLIRNEYGDKKVKFCSTECAEQYKAKFSLGKYKGRDIFLVPRGDVKGYLPYWDCLYYFTNIKDCMERIDSLIKKERC